eukprot:3079016-Rhodomonas_salina.2
MMTSSSVHRERAATVTAVAAYPPPTRSPDGSFPGRAWPMLPRFCPMLPYFCPILLRFCPILRRLCYALSGTELAGTPYVLCDVRF